jgi:hypothetical protein
MRKALLLSVLLVFAAPVAAETAACDATPFSLAKPVAAPAAKPAQVAPKPAPAAPKPVAAKPKPKPVPQHRLLATCKDGKAKKSG